MSDKVVQIQGDAESDQAFVSSRANASEPPPGRGAEAKENSPEGSTKSYVISDPQFMRQLANLRDLCEFIRREGIRIDADKAKLLVFGEVGRLRQASGAEKGREATDEEWTFVETRTQELHGLLDEGCRRGFYIRKSEWLLIWVPFLLISAAAGSLIAAFSQPTWVSYCYIVWLMVLGALGSVAYVTMNALELQNDITFDLGNKKLLIIRLFLGAIFGLILALPFGFKQFAEFAKQFELDETGMATSDTTTVAAGAAMLLMPFVFGFSTTVVLTIINRLVDAVGVVFGKPPPVRPT